MGCSLFSPNHGSHSAVTVTPRGAEMEGTLWRYPSDFYFSSPSLGTESRFTTLLPQQALLLLEICDLRDYCAWSIHRSVSAGGHQTRPFCLGN